MRRLLSAFLLAISVILIAMPANATDPVFARLSGQMQQQLDKQRAFVSALVAQRFSGQRLGQGRADLVLLQRLIDIRVISPTQTWELQAFGVVLGDALIAAVPGLAWWQVTDEYGTDPTLRYRTTTVRVNALTMLSKRVERGEDIDVQSIASQIAEFIEKKASEYK